MGVDTQKDDMRGSFETRIVKVDGVSLLIWALAGENEYAQEARFSGRVFTRPVTGGDVVVLAREYGDTPVDAGKMLERTLRVLEEAGARVYGPYSECPDCVEIIPDAADWKKNGLGSLDF